MEIIRDKAVTFILRKKTKDKSSIEEIFKSVSNYLVCQNFKVNIKELPDSGASLNSILNNIKLVNKIRSEIIHITGDVHYTVIGSKVPSVLTIHDVGSALNGSLVKRFIIKMLWFWLPALYADRITVISKFSKLELSKIIPYAKNKIRVVPNPINPNIEFFFKKFDSEYPIILHLGTKPNKNLERTIEALREIPCRLVIIGKLTDLQLKLLISNSIDYLNEFYLDYNAIINHYKNCDMVSFVSIYEGFGMPIIEAQKTGRPVITSNLSSMPEVGGEGAYYVDPFSIDSIRSAYVHVINNPSVRNNLISAGRENVKRFDIGNIVDQYLKVYEELI